MRTRSVIAVLCIAALLAAAMAPVPSSVSWATLVPLPPVIAASEPASVARTEPVGPRSVLASARRALQHRFRTVLCCIVLQFGALIGVPMRPEEIRDLMQTLNTPKLAQTDPEGDPDGDRPEAGEPPAV